MRVLNGRKKCVSHWTGRNDGAEMLVEFLVHMMTARRAHTFYAPNAMNPLLCKYLMQFCATQTHTNIKYVWYTRIIIANHIQVIVSSANAKARTGASARLLRPTIAPSKDV